MEETEETMSRSSEEGEATVVDEEKGFLPNESQAKHQPTRPAGLSRKFWLSAAINTGATAAIVFVNKRIFETESLRHAQVAFAAFHFAVTSALLYVISRPQIKMFEAKKVDIVRILPLAMGMIFNVVLPNASLAYSSIQFYQIMRVLVTPCVALLNFVLLRQTISSSAASTLIPVCVGAGVISYFDTVPAGDTQARGTTPFGVFFAFAGVFATSIYTVWIKKYHAVLDCTSMQLLFTQAPVSVLLMAYIIPFSDDITAWREVTWSTLVLILLSGGLACLITVSQFIIIHEAGPVSSTVVGHFKTCFIILLSWVFGGRTFSNGSLAGIALALGGILSGQDIRESNVLRKEGDQSTSEWMPRVP
ncbi:hypothetical protein LTR37_012832 [Vermiconidia calcicola]|uniref:Uncharacterized protein n=1 Tax=Vermiconidia calcicola TaxID=1690605 RepID=A0ACC3MZT4_9PEZI|nr:hypothetical protein LTR37_012832 [Vermiconidia calcicola]